MGKAFASSRRVKRMTTVMATPSGIGTCLLYLVGSVDECESDTRFNSDINYLSDDGNHGYNGCFHVTRSSNWMSRERSSALGEEEHRTAGWRRRRAGRLCHRGR